MRLLAALAMVLALPGVASAQIGRSGGPIDIAADETEFVDAERVLRWLGNVDARQGDSRLLADRMDVVFAEDGGDGPGAIERIVAVGGVAYITPTETAKGDRGVYDAASDIITITGNVLLIRGPNTSSGDRLIVEPERGRARLVGPEDNRGQRGADRTRAILFPSEDEEEGDAADDAE